VSHDTQEDSGSNVVQQLCDTDPESDCGYTSGVNCESSDSDYEADGDRMRIGQMMKVLLSLWEMN
jgi:hypothetical protein